MIKKTNASKLLSTCTEATCAPSARLFYPIHGALNSFSESAPTELQSAAVRGAANIKNLVTQPHYPCVAALRSYHQDDYHVGFYGQLGEGDRWGELRNDLHFYLQEQKESDSTYLTFWAMFSGAEYSEEDFEARMWRQLSLLTSIEDADQDWGTVAERDPAHPKFRFCLAGSEFFVVGLHPKASRLARQFPVPAMVFNVFSQFDKLKKLSQFDQMVTVNRKRDEQFQGTVNPMAAQYAEKWESIQFSGKQNPSHWRCPFEFLSRDQKP